MEQKKNSLIDKLDNIDYTHLLGYPSEVVAVEVMTLVKTAVNEYISEVVEYPINKDVMDALCYLRSKALKVAEGEVVIESFHQVHDYIKKLEFGQWEVRQGNGDPHGISEIWIDKGENGCGENLGKPYAGSWGEKT